MTVELLIPERRPVSLVELRALVGECAPVHPFDPPVVEVCADFSRRLMRDSEARLYPEITALAYWMRKAEILRLRGQFEALARPDRLLEPRGLVFHLPPRNVDTMFVYSWLLAALTGNANAMRLSPQRSRTSDVLLRIFAQVLAATGGRPLNTVVVAYGHEAEPTALLSELCDVRVVWGGDRTVESIRRILLPPHSRELTFADRYSLAAVLVPAYLRATETQRNELARQFFNDALWFDQMACSSPRLVVWCGEPAEARAASLDFFPRVAGYAHARGYGAQPAVAMQKLVFSCGAVLDLPVSVVRRHGDLNVLTLDSLHGFSRLHPGGGLFFEVAVDDLDALAPVLLRRDQTITVFGFAPADIHDFALSLRGRSIDRIVPFGEALRFHRFWDGYDLLQEFCRHVHLAPIP